jgi:DNA-binding NtrC family response regulator
MACRVNRPRVAAPGDFGLLGIRHRALMALVRYERVMRRILIVEDEPDALELLVSWIHHQRGWEVRSAQSGRSAMELSKTFKPDVVISDYLLQDDVTGVDVIAEVQSHDAPVRCVLVTGVLRKALLDVQRINGVPILTKPLDFRRLQRIISEPAS